MRRFQSAVWIILFGSLSAAALGAEPAAVETKPTKPSEVPAKDVVELSSEASPQVLRKAAHVIPTPQQLAWQEMELTAFVHVGMSTFTDRGFGGWGDGTDAPELFNPTALDADQWVSACRDAGMKMLILTCKHHNGFCLWPSKYTEYSVKNSPWRNGKGDVVKEVADACRRGGIKFGIYLSPWDQHEKTYGSDAYNDFYKNQLGELLTNYGEIAQVWWDGCCGEGPNGKRQVYDWEGYIKTVRQLQPNALAAIMGPDIRWVGNEVGLARESEWSVHPRTVIGNEGTMTPDVGHRKYLVGAKELAWYPAECCVSIRPNWFYLANEDGQVKSLKHLLDIYYRSVGLNSVLLLNVPPDHRGLFHNNDVARLHELRATLDETFRTNLAKDKPAKASSEAAGHTAQMAVDGNGDTYWTPADGIIQASLEIDLGQPVTFDRAMLQEMITTGQRVEQFELEAWDGQAWKKFAQATTIGHKRLLRFPSVTASKVRLTILDARDCPTIREFGLFKASAQE
jgi:alpha-L-fucosidase